MRWLYLLTLLFVFTYGAEIFVSSNATTGLGTQNSPATFATALGLAKNGDTITFLSGSYSFALTIMNLTITVRTLTGASIVNSPTLNVPSIYVNNSVVTFSGFQIPNFQTTFHVVNSNVVIDNCIFQNFLYTPKYLGAVQMDSGSVLVQNSQFLLGGPSIYVSGGSLNVVNTYFINITDQSSFFGAGIHADSGNVSVSSSYFVNTMGAILQFGGSLSVQNSSFFNSTAYNSKGSVQCSAGVTLSQSSNLFCGTTAPVVTCAGWTPFTVQADRCGVCLGRLEHIDCLGNCFGNAFPNNTVCPITTKTYYVSALNGSDTNNGLNLATAKATIQNAISTANSGDTVILAPGYYNGTGNIGVSFGGKAIKLTSYHNLAQEVIIDCGSGLAPGISLTSGEPSNTLIQGVTFINCVSSLKLVNSAVTVNNCKFLNAYNPIAPGAAISATDSLVFLQNSQIEDCFSSGGGNVYVTIANSLSTIVITNSRFLNNQADIGTGLDVTRNATAFIYNSFFINNTATTLGGGISAVGNLFISNTSFWQNGGGGAGKALSCPTFSTTPIVTSTNTFCGTSGNSIFCDGASFNLTTAVDTCHVCAGSNIELDCAGVCWGASIRDAFNICCLPSQFDCGGFCNGGRVFDNFGTCCPGQYIDCRGICYGGYIRDENGVCCNRTTFDCLALCNGGHRIDRNGTCCNGSLIDSCDICYGHNTCISSSIPSSILTNTNAVNPTNTNPTNFVVVGGNGLTSPSSTTQWIIVAVVLFVVLLLLLILIIVIVASRRHRRRTELVEFSDAVYVKQVSSAPVDGVKGEPIKGEVKGEPEGVKGESGVKGEPEED